MFFIVTEKPSRGFRKAWDKACIETGLCEVLKDDKGIRLWLRIKRVTRKW